MSVQNKVSEFMCCIEATTLGGFFCVQKDVRNSIPPKGESVNVVVVLGQGKDSDAICFQQMDHVFDRKAPASPFLTHCGGCRLDTPHVGMFSQIWKIDNWQLEARLDPLRQFHCQDAGCDGGITTPCAHRAERTKADGFYRRWVKFFTDKEIHREAQYFRQVPERFFRRTGGTRLVGGQASNGDRNPFCEGFLGHSATLSSQCES